MSLDPAKLAISAVNSIPAMVAYWDSNQRCTFSNQAYQEWFDRNPDEMVGMPLKTLLGPLYEKNLPHILNALRGEKQVFERQIPIPSGGVRESIATYTPDVVDGVVRGFWAHVAEVTMLREREKDLLLALQAKEEALAEVRTLRGLIPICAYCKKIHRHEQDWQQIEMYLRDHSEADFSHSICPDCMPKHYGDSLTKPNNA